MKHTEVMQIDSANSKDGKMNNAWQVRADIRVVIWLKKHIILIFLINGTLRNVQCVQSVCIHVHPKSLTYDKQLTDTQASSKLCCYTV